MKITFFTAILLAFLASQAAGQFQYERLKSFEFPEHSGDYPNGLIQGSDGALYGPTLRGGSNDTGTVFKLNTDGTAYTILRNFTGNAGDGSLPNGLVEGSDGALYGTTFSGGTNGGGFYGGTAFKLSKDGSRYAVLHSFTGSDGEGWSPRGLTEGSDGAFYGVTTDGGITNADTAFGRGTLFKLNKDGSGYAMLHSFTSGGDGWKPGGLVEGSDGALYGTTFSGGTNGGGFYGGTVFKLNKDGSGYALLHSFAAGPGGGWGPGGLMHGSDGALYGTTYGGGTNDEGTVFKLNKDGSSYEVLHSFTGGGDYREYPSTLLVEGSDGALYGTTIFPCDCKPGRSPGTGVWTFFRWTLRFFSVINLVRDDFSRARP